MVEKNPYIKSFRGFAIPLREYSGKKSTFFSPLLACDSFMNKEIQRSRVEWCFGKFGRKEKFLREKSLVVSCVNDFSQPLWYFIVLVLTRTFWMMKFFNSSEFEFKGMIFFNFIALDFGRNTGNFPSMP